MTNSTASIIAHSVSAPVIPASPESFKTYGSRYIIFISAVNR